MMFLFLCLAYFSWYDHFWVHPSCHSFTHWQRTEPPLQLKIYIFHGLYSQEIALDFLFLLVLTSSVFEILTQLQRLSSWRKIMNQICYSTITQQEILRICYRWIPIFLLSSCSADLGSLTIIRCRLNLWIK